MRKFHQRHLGGMQGKPPNITDKNAEEMIVKDRLRNDQQKEEDVAFPGGADEVGSN